MDPIRVFVVDDHEIVRDGLRTLLRDEPDIEVVGEAATAGEAMEAIPPAHPDVTLLDLGLPDGNGVEVCRALRGDGESGRFLVLTSAADDEALQGAVLAGADGYLVKHIRGDELVTCIRKVASGQPILDEQTRARVVERLHRRTTGERDRVEGLSAQEQRVLDLLANGMSNRQIAAQLGLAEKTVKNYVSNMLAKLGMARRTEAAVYAAGLAERARARPRGPMGTAVRF